MIAESLAQFNAMRKGSAIESKDIVKEAFLAGFEAGRDSEGQYITDELLDSAYERYLKS